MTEDLFPLKLILARACTTYLTLCGICPAFDWKTVSLTGGSVAAPQRHTYFCTSLSSSRFTSNSFYTTFLVIFWAVVESLLLSSSCNSGCTYSTFVWLAPVALPVSVSVLKLSLFAMTIGGFPYTMSRGQALEISASCKALMEYKRRKMLWLMHIPYLCNMSSFHGSPQLS